MDRAISRLLREKKVSRRELMRYLWWGGAGLLVAEGVGATLASLWPKVEAGSFGTEISAGKAGDYPVGSITYFKDSRFYLSRLETGFLALYRKCTHLGCVVPWREGEQSEDDLAARGRFNCPCHASIFNRYGEVKGGPAPRPLDLFPLRVVGDQLLVDTGTIIRRGTFDESQVTTV